MQWGQRGSGALVRAATYLQMGSRYVGLRRMATLLVTSVSKSRLETVDTERVGAENWD